MNVKKAEAQALKLRVNLGAQFWHNFALRKPGRGKVIQ